STGETDDVARIMTEDIFYLPGIFEQGPRAVFDTPEKRTKVVIVEVLNYKSDGYIGNESLDTLVTFAKLLEEGIGVIATGNICLNDIGLGEIFGSELRAYLVFIGSPPLVR